jgi:hypothetical protein
LRSDELVAVLAGATVVRVDHLVELGFTRSTIAHRCRPGGPWRRLAPGIVKLDNGPVTRADRRRAVLLLAGAGAVLTGLDALELHGMRRMPAPSGPVHVLIPGAADGAPDSRARLLLEISDGVRSVAEADAREIAQRSGLPAPLWNAKLYDRHGRFIAMPDAWFDAVGMAWEIDSREFHLSPADYERTLARRSAMMTEGIIVLHTLPKKLAHRADAQTELWRVYTQAARRPRPEVIAIPQG